MASPSFSFCDQAPANKLQGQKNTSRQEHRNRKALNPSSKGEWKHDEVCVSVWGADLLVSRRVRNGSAGALRHSSGSKTSRFTKMYFCWG
jgi:hypothetical protein